MAKSSLKERLARQGRVQAIPRVTNGNPEVIVLRPGCNSPNVITATLALVKRGATMLKAKRAVEMALASGRAAIDLPMVEDRKVLSDELGAAGITATYGGDAGRAPA